MIGSLAAHLWQSTVFACVAALLTLAFRRNRAQVRYWLWLAASLKFLVPFSLLMSVGSRIEWTPAARQIAPPQISITVERLAEPFPDALPPAPTAPAVLHWTPGLLLCVWAGGFGALAILRLRGWLQVRAAVRAGTPVAIPAAVEIRAAPGLLEPGVVGLWRPVLLLPDGILERLTPGQLEAVLAHELCHVRRRDNLFAAVHMLVEAAFWFHPLVWWIGTRLVEERERACDESVLSLGNEPRTYADAILGVCKLYVESPLACVSGVTGANLKRRIEAIMTNRTAQGLNRAKKLLLAGAGATALAGPIVIGLVIGAGHPPSLHAQPAAEAPAPAAAPPSAQADTPPAATPQRAAENLYKDHRLMAMLFDLDAMNGDEQSRARQSAVQFVDGRMEAHDLVALMAVNNGKVAVLQDFTNDHGLLKSSISGLNGGNVAEASPSSALEHLKSAVRMLGVVAEKKVLMYFSSTMPSAGVSADLVQSAVAEAQQANVAFYPVDARGVSDQVSASSEFHSMSGANAPADLSKEELTRRMAYVRANLGSAGTPMGRTYMRYGAPDQTETRGGGQVWRYNYVEAFHSNVEFEFPAGSRTVRINWPPAAATFTGASGVDSELAERLLHSVGGAGTQALADMAQLPGGHATLQTYPAGEPQMLTVPLGSLSGTVRVEGAVRMVPGTGAQNANAGFGETRQVKDSSATAQTNFRLPAGSYVCSVMVKEESTGQIYGETIYFQVQ